MTSLPPIVQRARRWLHVLAHLDRLEPYMAADRDLITTILAALPAIADGVAAKDAKIASLTQQLADAGAAAAADEAEDTAALAPVAEAVQALRDALAPQVDGTPTPIPVEEVPAAVAGPEPLDGAADPQPSSGPETAEQPPA